MLFDLLLLCATASALSINPQSPLHRDRVASNPSEQDESTYKIPSIHESTVMARRILHLSSIGTLVTSFPDPHSHDSSSDLNVLENRPAEVVGSPIGLMEYYADCEPATGNPTLLAINIATPFKNYGEGSNISLSIRWWPKQTNYYPLGSFYPSEHLSDDEDIPTPHTPAALPRFSLHGHLEPISALDLAKGVVPACFLRSHPDSVLWQPGNDIHTSQYMRFVVEYVYWFGGFGDRARIGWLPIEEWRGVTMEEIAAYRLPGEEEKGKGKGKSWWREWL